MSGHQWHEVARIAAAQHGTWAVWQSDVHKELVARWVRNGLLHRLHRGVYAVGHTAVSPLGRLMAAVLAGGPGAVASHRSAAALHGFRKHAGLPEVTVPRTGARRRKGIRLHASTTLTSHNSTRVHGIPVTTPARTLTDLADVLSDNDLARAVSAAERAGLIDRHALQRPNGRRNPVRRPHVWTRSQFERRFRKAIQDWGLPPAKLNQYIGEYEYDVVWRDQRVAVELDHPHTHLNPEAFELDPLKAEAAEEAGFAFRRITEKRFATRPLEVRAMLIRLVGGEL
ncbi:MAG: hypothetical protein QOE86_2775 [Solirubrobacteraceae bacterium]|nr:hypothetical protein [Solirubrobacteraceae bacterium]